MIQEVREEDLSTSDPLEPALRALNNEHAQELSYLDEAAFRQLVRNASVVWRIGLADAFLVAFDRDATYANPNFEWFKERYDRFLYIDRVVVAHASRGRGYARKLYEALFALAGEKGYEHIVCEVNLSPPNPASDAFHQSMGFTEVGTASIHNGMKTVRYFQYQVGSRPR